MHAAPSRGNIEKLHTILGNESSRLAEMELLLSQEFDALSAQDGERVATLTREKNTLLQQLERVAGEKHQLLEAAGFPQGGAGLHHFLDSAAVAPLNDSWSIIERQLHSCQRQNQINGQLLEAQRRQAQQLLAILVGASATPAELYTAKGNTTLSTLSTQTRSKA